MKKFTKMFVGVFCALLIIAATASAATTNAPALKSQTQKEAWTLTVGGNGSTEITGAKNTAFGLDLSLGRTGHLLLPLEAGVRQNITYSQPNTVATTRVYADWTLLNVSKLDIFAGGNIGASYGNAPLIWKAAPEAGVRLWLKKDVALEGRVEVPLNMNNGRFGDAVVYMVGLKIKL